MVSHANRHPLPQPVQLFANTRLVLPYYLALKEQQARRAGEAAAIDKAALPKPSRQASPPSP